MAESLKDVSVFVPNSSSLIDISRSVEISDENEESDSSMSDSSVSDSSMSDSFPEEPFSAISISTRV